MAIKVIAPSPRPTDRTDDTKAKRENKTKQERFSALSCPRLLKMRDNQRNKMTNEARARASSARKPSIKEEAGRRSRFSCQLSGQVRCSPMAAAPGSAPRGPSEPGVLRVAPKIHVAAYDAGTCTPTATLRDGRLMHFSCFGVACAKRRSLAPNESSPTPAQLRTEGDRCGTGKVLSAV